MLQSNLIKDTRAYGTFMQKNDRFYRTEAYLQWGQSDDILGTVVMLNPGQATLKHDSFQEGFPIHDEITVDQTMRSLIDLVESFHKKDKELSGRLYIYNLFPLQHTRKDDAIKEFNKLWESGELLVTSLPKPPHELKRHINQSPWVLTGWGINHKSAYLKQLKDQWMDIIKETKTPILGKKKDATMEYYHVRPQLRSKQLEYKEELMRQYDERVM